MSDEFAGRLAFITGGASGIGLATGQVLAERGMKVVLADIDETALERAERSVPGARGIVLDVTDRDAWTAALDEAEAAFGPLAMLFCNAGVAGSRLSIADTSIEGWEWTRSILLDGVFHGLNLGVPRLLASGKPGHVVATASIGGLIAMAGNGVYGGMKAAVIAMCEALRLELAETQVNASVLLPGLVSTNILDENRKRKPDGIFVGDEEPELEAAMHASMDPRQVGEIVANAIGTDRFWLFTHPELRDMVAQRSQEIDEAYAAQA